MRPALIIRDIKNLLVYSVPVHKFPEEISRNISSDDDTNTNLDDSELIGVSKVTIPIHPVQKNADADQSPQPEEKKVRNPWRRRFNFVHAALRWCLAVLSSSPSTQKTRRQNRQTSRSRT